MIRFKFLTATKQKKVTWGFYCWVFMGLLISEADVFIGFSVRDTPEERWVYVLNIKFLVTHSLNFC